MVLVHRVALIKPRNYELISDIFRSNKQKVLVKAIFMLFPNVEIRHCVRHLHANFKQASFKTKAFKYFLWKVAKVSTPRDFEDAMVELKNTNQDSYD
ncbi:hypothetical protein J1N35_044686 [Gossypium stocksii]|uniref:MULE transposase domain-containing protein n=1 Tax=Gossypium stocksii TaxID=47602 RepID=A0A9D3ZGH8_9ROSI|nr:hypothetical protein J1N35_044686 [Gossypium stocksii]